MDFLEHCILEADLITEGLLVSARLFLVLLIIDFSPCFLIPESMRAYKTEHHSQLFCGSWERCLLLPWLVLLQSF